MSASDWILVVLLFGFTTCAAVLDSRTRRIPNWLTVPVFVCGLLFHLVTGGLLGLGNSLAGFAIGFSILFVLWLIGGGGGGDVKLMGALGACVGVKPIIAVFFLSVLFAALMGMAMSFTELCRRGVQLNRRGSAGDSAETKAKRRLLPYAVPVAISTWLFLAYVMLIQSTTI